MVGALNGFDMMDFLHYGLGCKKITPLDGDIAAGFQDMIDKKLSLKPHPPIAALYTTTISIPPEPVTIVVTEVIVTDPTPTTYTVHNTYTVIPTLSATLIPLIPSEEPSIASDSALPSFNTSLSIPMVSSRAEAPVASGTFITTITVRPTGMVSSRDEPTPITFTLTPGMTITLYPHPPTSMPFAKRGDRGYYIMDWLKSMKCNMKDPHQMQMAKFLHAFMFNSADI